MDRTKDIDSLSPQSLVDEYNVLNISNLSKEQYADAKSL
jgi:hypothetical protein